MASFRRTAFVAGITVAILEGVVVLGTFLAGSIVGLALRRIDYILVRCGEHGGPTLRIAKCARTFDQPDSVVSDHQGVAADLELPAPAG
ncbi:MAG: hypothetical protein WAM30_01320 [Candidatus Dormiibacterota bacterium]